MNSQPGWYPDPQNPATMRFWNGQQWTADTQPNSLAGAPVITQPAPKKSVAASNLKTVGIIALIVIVTLVAASLINDALNPDQVEQQQYQQAIDTRNDLQSDQTILDPTSYKEISSRDLEVILKDVRANSGQRIVLYGSISQFDSATGPGRFLASVGTSSLGVGNFESAHMVGDPATLQPFVKGDDVKIYVIVDGEFSYTSAADIKFTVPQFQVGIIELAE